MKFDHIAVTQTTGIGKPHGSYQVRAELQNTPSVNWKMQFQLAWYNSPACLKLCSDVRLDDNSIFIQLDDSTYVTETVDALKTLMVSMELPRQMIAPYHRKSVI